MHKMVNFSDTVFKNHVYFTLWNRPPGIWDQAERWVYLEVPLYVKTAFPNLTITTLYITIVNK